MRWTSGVQASRVILGGVVKRGYIAAKSREGNAMIEKKLFMRATYRLAEIKNSLSTEDSLLRLMIRHWATGSASKEQKQTSSRNA